jgi:RNA polymerase sigma factor (sigma-70 family)
MTDQELLEKFRDPSGRNYAFNLMVRKYQQKIYWHIRKMVIDHDDANDLTQETFIKVWSSLEQFRGDSQLYTWIYRIATNECLNFLNKKRRRFFLPIGDVEGELMEKLEANADLSTSGGELSGEEIQLKLQKALLKLPDKQRLVFNMKYFDDMKYEEIAAITGTSVGALKASYHLATKKIEDFLTNSDH